MKTIAIIISILCTTAGAAQWLTPPADGVAPSSDIDALLAKHPLGANENIKVVPLAKSEHSAQVLVQVRDREPLHYHADSDITVFLVRGQGTLQLEKRAHPVKAGDVLHIPRGAIHAYINKGPAVGVAVVSYSPAPGPDDRVLIKDSK